MDRCKQHLETLDKDTLVTYWHIGDELVRDGYNPKEEQWNGKKRKGRLALLSKKIGKSRQSISQAYKLRITYPEVASVTSKVKSWYRWCHPQEQEIESTFFIPQIYNVWNFSNRDKRFGLKYNGNIPGQIVQNILYYFSQENDLIVDPMAGGGITVDVCRTMNRRCLSYDLNPIHEEIVKNDINNGFPKEAKNCDLIFLDPPYFNMVYNLFPTIEDFYLFMKRLAEFSFETVKENGIVALVMQDMTEKGNYCLSGECYLLFRHIGFETVAHISCPLSSQNYLHLIDKAQAEKRMIGRNRDIYIFRKP